MSALIFKNKQLYMIVLAALGMLAILSFGPGLVGKWGWWTYRIFDPLCHQLPSRSYLYQGAQMAVCSRCLGIYTSMFAGWILMPVFGIAGLNKRAWLNGFFIFAVSLNLFDILGNYFELWSNTLTSRLLLGILFGLSAAVLVNDEFFYKKEG